MSGLAGDRVEYVGARVARFELPGRRWYFAVCAHHQWVGLDWKHKEQAKRDRDDHNDRSH